MTQIENSSKKIKENKYKILRMSLLLGQDKNREETINNFEESAREIDAMNNETYLEELENKFYDTETLEEEQKKLTDLVDYIKGRIYQRESLLSDYINITGRNLMGLGNIKYENNLDEYEERLKYINEYLENTKNIESNKKELEKLKEILINEEKQREKNETKNEELEKNLLEKFERIAKNKIDVDSLSEENIDSEIDKIKENSEESKKSLDIFRKSFETLKNAGISYEDETEYKSYVIGARDIYYDYKETEFLLEIYKLLLTNETEYINIYNKREYVNNILNERLELRKELEITEEDKLNEIYKILDNQNEIVSSQKENIDNIETLKSQISILEEKTQELKEDNEKVEILTILKEFNIIDTYEKESIPEIKFNIPEIDSPVFETETSEINNVFEEDTEEKNIEEEITNENETNESNIESIPEIELISQEENIEIPSELDLNLDLPEVQDMTNNNEIETETSNNVTNDEEESSIKEDNEIRNETPEKGIEENTEKQEEKEIQIEEPVVSNSNKNNFVMSCHDPIGLNVDECLEKANKVMRKVGEMLNIKVEEPTNIEITKVEQSEENTSNPFVAEQENPFLNNVNEETTKTTVAPEQENPFLNNEQQSQTENNNTSQSNVKNVLPNADDFWNNQMTTDNESEGIIPDVDVSNDDFFANSMNNFEFPNLDEFK